MANLVLNKLRLSSIVTKPLCELSEEDGSLIGRALSQSLALYTSPDIGVSEWINQHPSLREFSEGQKWFKPMIEVVAKQLLKEATWGVKLRLFVGAGMSMLDMGSDVTMIVVSPLATPLPPSFTHVRGAPANPLSLSFCRCTLTTSKAATLGSCSL